MDIGVVVRNIPERSLGLEPWMLHQQELGKLGIHVHISEVGDEVFSRRFDAMILHNWLDWKNPHFFTPKTILPVMARYAVYRAEFPDTVQIILNHTDMSRRPYATPYWRAGDPVLYRTPAYDRSELYPFPPESIFPYEKVWGSPVFVSDQAPQHKAGFAGTNSGPKGYRQRVAEQTARVGVGLCAPEKPLAADEYHRLMAACEILVCPQGWGEQSRRHWDVWHSGKPMLIDRAGDSVELIPGLRLREGEHYLVFDEPEQIPSIVEHWTHPSRREALAEIARRGREAALSYDSLGQIAEFFRRVVPSRDATP